MAETLSYSPPSERGPIRKLVDKGFFGISLVTLPLSLYVAGTSILAGEFTKSFIASGFAFLDFTQIRQHGKAPTEQSWYNPERIMDKVLGSLRFQQPTSTRMALASS